MLLGDLIDRARARNNLRFPGGGENATSKFSDMVKDWLVSGASVAAIFDSKGNFISVHDSHNQAIAKARGYRNSGMDCRIKNVRI